MSVHAGLGAGGHVRARGSGDAERNHGLLDGRGLPDPAEGHRVRGQQPRDDPASTLRAAGDGQHGRDVHVRGPNVPEQGGYLPEAVEPGGAAAGVYRF